MVWLQEVAARVLSESRPQHLRAIDLFEFQGAVLFPDDDEMVNDARLFCAIKLLEHVMALRVSSLIDPPRLADLAAIPDYTTFSMRSFFRTAGSKNYVFSKMPATSTL